MYIAARSKSKAASAHVWKTVNRNGSNYHNDVAEHIDQESPERMTDVILTGMPGYLKVQLNKKPGNLDAIADRTRAEIDEELTPQQDCSGIYLS